MIGMQVKKMVFVLIDTDRTVYSVEYEYILVLNALIEELKRAPTKQFHIIKMRKRSELDEYKCI